MSYLAAGWNTFCFLISPKEMEDILTPYHLVINNQHVPMDYTESAISEYIQAYGALYEMLMSGVKITWARDYPLFVHRAITSNLSGCKYGRVHMYEGKQYKLADFEEPAVNISPFALTFHKDEKYQVRCSTEYSYTQFAECFMGVRLTYPKYIQYKRNDTYTALQSTQDLRSYQDYERLKDSVKKITKPLTVIAADKVKKVNARISAEAKKSLNACYSFQQNNVVLK